MRRSVVHRATHHLPFPLVVDVSHCPARISVKRQRQLCSGKPSRSFSLGRWKRERTSCGPRSEAAETRNGRGVRRLSSVDRDATLICFYFPMPFPLFTKKIDSTRDKLLDLRCIRTCFPALPRCRRYARSLRARRTENGKGREYLTV